MTVKVIAFSASEKVQKLLSPRTGGPTVVLNRLLLMYFGLLDAERPYMDENIRKFLRTAIWAAKEQGIDLYTVSGLWHLPHLVRNCMDEDIKLQPEPGKTELAMKIYSEICSASLIQRLAMLEAVGIAEQDE